MPIYEYQCEACTHKFDTLQKFSDAVLTKCPECEKESLRKLISAAAFRLKGEGWYETDFKSGNKKNIAGNEPSDSASSDSSSTKSGDSKKSEKKPESSKNESKGKSDSKTSQKSSSNKNNASQGKH